MFWGLIMEPGRCYSQYVKRSFHISMAALDISNSGDDPAQVMCVYEGRNYLICTLDKQGRVQCQLDLNFEEGSKISFATNGNSHVHLTGYLTTFDCDETSEDDALEEEEEEVSMNAKRRLRNKSAEGPPKKKSKKEKSHNSLLEKLAAEEDDSSDATFDADKLENEDLSEEESGEEEEQASDDDDDDENDDNDVEEEEEASSLSDDEEEIKSKIQIKPSVPKLNGNAKTETTTQKKQKTKQNKSDLNPTKPAEKQTKQEQKKTKPKKTVLKGGVIVEDLQEGTGTTAQSGNFLHLYYEGRLKDSTKVFDSVRKGPGFKFKLGKNEVIRGWEIGLPGMKVGGKRRIVCPPPTAYGAKGSPPVIPPNATLVFDIELKKIN